jgi:Protein of unknown function (DUF2971)
MNDPMEGLLRPSVIFKDDLPSFEVKSAAVKKAMAKLGIASFAEAHKNEPMWAHYGGKFNGICIAYDFKKLLGALEGGAFVRMNYSEQAPVLSVRGKLPSSMARVALSTKNDRWMSEREWRLFASTRGPVHYTDPSCVTGIYLGARISNAEKRIIHDRLRQLKPAIPLFQMSIDGYDIKFLRYLKKSKRRSPAP